MDLLNGCLAIEQSKSSCKKIKNKCKAMKDEINQILVQTLQKQSELEANAAELEVKWRHIVLFLLISPG